MKKEKSLWSSIPLLTGSVVFILSLCRGKLQAVLLVAVLLVWLGWAVIRWLMPYIEEERRRRFRREQQALRNREACTPPQPEAPKNKSAVETLLRHVNYRITAYIQSLYPMATWQWCEKNPVKLILEGGTGRVKVHGAEDYTHADITVFKSGGIQCSMVKVVPVSEKSAEASDGNPVPPNKQPVDPRIWYEVTGRAVLEDVMADLNSRGHSKLMLKENGEIIIEEDEQDMTADRLSGFPAKVYWPRLVKVLQGEGLSAEVLAKGIQVSW